MKRIVFALVAMVFSLSLAAESSESISEGLPLRMSRQVAAPKKLSVPSSDWDASRVYRQIVILFEFNDTVFSMPDALQMA